MKIDKPWGITINVVLLMIAGIITLLATIGLLIGASFYSVIDEIIPIIDVIGIFIAFTAIVSLLTLVLAYFLWKGEEIAWWITLIFLSLGLITNIGSLLFMVSFPVIMIAIEIFLILG